MTSVGLITDALTLTNSPIVQAAMSVILTVFVAGQLFRLFLLAGDGNSYSWEDDYFEYWEHGYSSQEEWEAEVNASGGRRSYFSED